MSISVVNPPAECANGGTALHGRFWMASAFVAGVPYLRPIVLVALAVAVQTSAAGGQDPPRFRSDVDFVEITATVTDKDGRFAAGLRQEDFSIYEDGVLQAVTHFSAERSPVSLGILLDASGSMNPDKLKQAKDAVTHLVSDLLHPDDELFFVEFGYSASLTQEWTTDRRLIRRAIQDVQRPTGDTAMYDAIALALPTAQSGRHGKKALLVISDGNDTKSVISLAELHTSILQSDVLIYALGIGGSIQPRTRKDERLNAASLRQVTDDTGGRTEIVHGRKAFDIAVTTLAEELRHQYSLGYVSATAKDGRPHAIRVDVRDRRLTVRARRGVNQPIN